MHGGWLRLAVTATGMTLAAPALAQTVDPLPRMPVERLGTTVERRLPVGRNFRIRLDVARQTLEEADGRDHLHQRLSRSMVDVFPIAGEGFRLSAGGRFYGRKGRDDPASRGLFYAPPPSRALGVRATGRRATPAVTVGYERTLAPALSVGVEAGALKGRVDAPLARDYGGNRALAKGSQPVGSIVNLDVALRF